MTFSVHPLSGIILNETSSPLFPGSLAEVSIGPESQKEGGTSSESLTNFVDPSKDQFEGCLVGGLVGNCYGALFQCEAEEENEEGFISWEIVQKYFDAKMESKQAPITNATFHIRYARDSSMTATLVNFILEDETFNYKAELDLPELTIKLTRGYFTEKFNRHYGDKCRWIFTRLGETNCEPPFEPALVLRDQIQDLGLGDREAAAQFTSPLVLLHVLKPQTTGLPEQLDQGGDDNSKNISLPVDDQSNLVNLIVSTSSIIHTHPLDLIGSILYALVLRQAMLVGAQRNNKDETTKSNDENVVAIAKILKAAHHGLQFVAKMKRFSGSLSIRDAVNAYQHKLELIERLIDGSNKHVKLKNIRRGLQIKDVALSAVPTAIFCFLAAFQQISFIRTTNQFQRTIQLAVFCGGDRATITSMAGAMAGAYLGINELPQNLQNDCEGVPEFIQYGELLFDKYKNLNKQFRQCRLRGGPDFSKLTVDNESPRAHSIIYSVLEIF